MVQHISLGLDFPLVCRTDNPKYDRNIHKAADLICPVRLKRIDMSKSKRTKEEFVFMSWTPVSF